MTYTLDDLTDAYLDLRVYRELESHEDFINHAVKKYQALAKLFDLELEASREWKGRVVYSSTNMPFVFETSARYLAQIDSSPFPMRLAGKSDDTSAEEIAVNKHSSNVMNDLTSLRQNIREMILEMVRLTYPEKAKLSFLDDDLTKAGFDPKEVKPCWMDYI